VSDHPDKIDAEKETRIIELVFFFGLEVANTTERPSGTHRTAKRSWGTF
jgi:hypothetical protein